VIEMIAHTEATHGTTSAEASPPPPVVLLELMNGYWITQSIAVAAELGIADHLDAGPRSATDLATATGADPDSIARLLRALAMVGVFTEEDGGYGLTPVGAALRSDVPGSLRALARMRGSDWQWRAWSNLVHSVRTGETALDHVYGKPLFEFLADHPADGEVFNEAMISHASQMHAAVVGSYDLPEHGTVVDVGCGHGTLIAAILRANPTLRATAFDLPRVLDGARGWLGQHGLADRCDFVAGDFFDSVPPGGDVYALSHVVHDWDDGRALRLLRNCRANMPPHARLAVCEMVLPEGPEPHFGKLLDLEMLVNTGGRERTLGEYRRLYEQAGFELIRVVPTHSPVSVVEGIPV
jgi:SAM-dependent methyltransferase